MATTKLMETKDGRRFYRISVSRGYGVSPYSMRWYVPEGKSQKTIDRELAKVAADFENKCHNGEIHNRAEVKEQIAIEKAAEAKIQTLEQYSERVFMKELAVTCSEHTRSSFEGNLKNHIIPVLGSMKMPSITSEDISALLLSLQADKGMKHASVIKVYGILNLIFKKAYLSHMIDRNPMDFVQRPKPTKAEGKDTEVKAFSLDEIVYIMECIENEPLQWQAFTRLLIDTGARKGEILGLTWNNVDFNENLITIEKTLGYTPEKGIYTDTPKNGKKRTIPVDESVIALLKQLRIEQGDIIKIQSTHSDRHGFVFTQEDGVTPMHPDTPTRRFKKYEKMYGIKDFHPHKLRHSFASIAITNGADIASVSEKLGHADKGTTLRMYTHADIEAQKRASEIFRDAIKRKQA